jgi:adenine/guanine phosphoribosyltransferase-like PRPP-binding protein
MSEKSEHLENCKYEHSSYLENLIRVKKLKLTVDNCQKALSRHVFDAIAFRGLSGSLIAVPLALAMGKEIIAVRKDSDFFAGADKTHSYHHVEGYKACKRYVIVDDLISSGRTANMIVAAIKKFAPLAKCVGLLEAIYVDRYAGPLSNYEGKPAPLHVFVKEGYRYTGWEKTEFSNHPVPRPKFSDKAKEALAPPVPQPDPVFVSLTRFL